MKSMTGFAESSVNTKVGKIRVEIRSENHRFLEIKVSVPELLFQMETAIENSLKNSIQRGKLRLRLSLQTSLKEKQRLSEKVLRENHSFLKKINSSLGIKTEIGIEHLLMVENYFESQVGPEISKETETKIREVVKKNLEKFQKSREAEGQKLEKAILKRMETIKKTVEDIKKKRKEFVKKSEKKTKEKIERIFSSSQKNDPVISQEAAALVTEKSEIDEEIVRLEAHISKFRKTAKKKSPVGKELDFLVQEMNREVGTVSAKCKVAGISHLTIKIRLELEKIREQVQNIE
ncbi:MAG: YicC family protein [Candidatus Dadabacteria bacterium]|nr:YicC family protein [Candidatus Dadabacteria bacterium]MCY4262332.1 YicC family protein [Candidatus Dadabacteria bacterium]